MVVCATTSDDTAHGRVGRSRDLVAVELEVGDILSGSGDGHGALCILDAVGPTSEGVTLVGRSREGDVLKVVVCATTSDDTAHGRVGCSRDLVAVDLEVGDVSGSFCDREGECCISGDHFAVLGPVGEGVSLVGCGSQCAGSAVVIRSSTCDGTASSRVGRSRDLIAVELEVGHVSCRFGDEEGERCIGADHFAVLGPVGEGVAFVGSD